MRYLKPIYIVGRALEPAVLDDDTLIFLHRRTDATLFGIAVIPAEDIHKYAATGNMKYAAMTIPFDEDVDGALRKAFPEKGVDTNFIFGSQAARAYDEGDLFDDDSERTPHTLAEYNAAASEHEGTFVHRTWNTKAEADAYTQGIDDMYDWMVYVSVEDKDIKKEDNKP